MGLQAFQAIWGTCARGAIWCQNLCTVQCKRVGRPAAQPWPADRSAIYDQNLCTVQCKRVASAYSAVHKGGECVQRGA